MAKLRTTYIFPAPPLIGDLFIHSFVQQMFIEHFPRLTNSSRSWEYSSEQNQAYAVYY